jgi:vacuolar protein sorting-associated protein 53
LSRLFGKWLQQYAEQILLPRLEGKPPPTTQEVRKLLNTADYCLTTTSQLEERIQSKVDDGLKDQVQFSAARESFIQIANAAIKALVKKVEAEADISFREMVNTNWAAIETVGDHSSYVNEMRLSIRGAVSEISAQGHLRERYIRTLCDRVVEWFGNKFIEGIVAARPISEPGAEQVRPQMPSLM